MKGAKGRKKPILPFTWQIYLSAEYHRLLGKRIIKPWNEILVYDEFPIDVLSLDDGLTEQVVGEVWELEGEKEIAS
jgi:hypothetical protein